jgi:hypothetical protein
MRPSERRKWKSNNEPSPREKREMIERGEWSEDEERDESGKAPMVFRLIAWASLVVIFFAVGYGATSLVFKWMDNRGGERQPSNLVRNQDEAADLLTQMASARSGDASAGRDSATVVTISIPDGNMFLARQIRCPAGLREDTMGLALSAYMDAMKESQMLGAGARTLNIFQSGDWLYLNMNKDFLESLKTLGSDKSRLLLTGMVKTMSDNFAPVNKIKFYIDGEEVMDKRPVDLTMPWGIASSSR